VAIICLKIAFGERVRLNKRVHFSITEFPGTSNDIEIYAGAYLWYVSLDDGLIAAYSIQLI